MINQVFAEYYQIEELLGKGAYGVIYKVQDLKDTKKYAAKFENIESQHQELYVEYKILQRLTKLHPKAVGVPRVFYYGVTRDKNMLVTELLGGSLADKLAMCNGKFSLKTVLMIAEQLIKRVEFIHSNRIIHRDLSPSNMCIGMGKTSQTVYLIDFGKAKKYMDSRGKHIEQKQNKLPVGNIRYSSINSDAGIELSRRDDLESMMYILIYFLNGSLPWQRIKAKTLSEKFKQVKAAKASISVSAMCKDFPPEFAILLQYIQKLGFQEEPDYARIKEYFRKMFVNANFQLDYQYDWKSLQQRGQSSGRQPGPPAQKPADNTRSASQGQPVPRQGSLGQKPK